MNILVTGGAGYKGVLLVKRLLDRGHSVTLLDNFIFGYQCVLHLVPEPGLCIRQMDIRNIEGADVTGFDAVFHLAGVSGMPACAANPYSAETINVQGTARLCKFLNPGQLLIYASTTSFYGASGQDCDESSEVKPVSIYGRTKYEAERIVLDRRNSIALRFATVFGLSPRMRSDLLVNDFAYKAVKDRVIVVFAGHSKRTFIHIDDAIEGYLFALDNAGRMQGNAYNVGGEALNFSKLDIVAALLKYRSFEVVNSTLPDLDRRDFVVSFRKMTDLGYCVKLGLDEGILSLMKLYEFFSRDKNGFL
jgi:nucleoside-diphosphate-sugar epimerase